MKVAGKSPDLLFWLVIILGLAGLIWAVWQSKRETVGTQSMDSNTGNARAALAKD